MEEIKIELGLSLATFGNIDIFGIRDKFGNSDTFGTMDIFGSSDTFGTRESI